MARYKWIATSPRFLAVELAKQLLPVSFEHAVHHLFEHEIDLVGGFAARYRNDLNGARAYPPGMLLKVILCTYARCVVSSRGIERLCREACAIFSPKTGLEKNFSTACPATKGWASTRSVTTCEAHGLYAPW